MDEVDAIEKVFAEGVLLDHCLEVGIGSADDANVGSARFAVAQHFVGLVLQHAQQLHLAGHRQFADFIEEYRTAASHLKAPYAVFLGIGECALFVAEHLAFEERSRDSTEVHLHKWAIRPLTLAVDSLGYEFLARAALARNEHRRISGSHAADRGKDAGE